MSRSAKIQISRLPGVITVLADTVVATPSLPVPAAAPAASAPGPGSA